MQGVSSLRGLERLSRLNMGCMWACGGILPDHSVLGRFVQRHGEELREFGVKELTREVLRRTGSDTGSLAGDGTVVQAAASAYRKLSEEAGDVVNLGVGVSAGIPNVAAEEGIVEQFTPTVEAGVIGGIEIRREGRIRKFVPAVRQVTYNGTVGRERGQQVLFVTERAVLRLTDDAMVLTEIAPGVRLQEDVLEQIGFHVQVSPDLAPMDARLFRKGPMGLAASFGA